MTNRIARRAADMPPELLGKLKQVIRQTEDRVAEEAKADVLDWLRDPAYAGALQNLRDWGEIARMHAAAAAEIERFRQTAAEERRRIVAWHRAQAVAMRAEAAATRQDWYREKCEARAECYEHAAAAIERGEHEKEGGR